MEALDLMYYTITVTLLVFLGTLLYVLYQLSIFFANLRKFMLQLQALPLAARIAAGSIQSTLLSLVVKLFGRK